MMPKVTLRATDGTRGTIHASASGKAYNHDADGFVTVDSIDAAALMQSHERVHVDHVGRDPDAAPISSVATGSHEMGATAVDPAKREMYHRPPPIENGQQSSDFGGAQPPHGLVDEGISTDATRADAQEEVDTARRAGADPTHRSHVANTGHMGMLIATEADHAAVRREPEAPVEKVDEPVDLTKQAKPGDGGEPMRKDAPAPTGMHDGAYGDFKDHAGQEDPTLRGKTKAEIDADGKA